MKTLIKIGYLVLMAAILMSLMNVSSAQNKTGGKREMVIEKSFEADDFFMLPELAAGIIQDGETIKFDLMAPADNLPEQYKDVDIIKGDLIIMMNGKRVKSVQDIRAMYEGIAVGEEIKFGLKRDGNMMMAALKKADQADLPATKMMVMTVGNDDVDSIAESISNDGTSMIKLKGDANSKIMIEAGLVFNTEGGEFKITHVLPVAPKEISENIESGWNIVSIQGLENATADEIMNIFDEINAGEMVTIVFEKEGDKKEITFNKPDMRTNIRRTKDK